MSGIMAMLLGRLAAGGGTFTVVQTFTATGTWTAPTGVTEVEYLVVAGGGGGGEGNYGAGGGGGAGGYRTGTGLSVTAGTDYTVTVGNGGAGATAASNVNGAAGGDTSIAGFGTIGNITNLFDILKMVPPYYMQIAIGIYIIEIIFILTKTYIY
jgi:hypothetical protein